MYDFGSFLWYLQYVDDSCIMSRVVVVNSSSVVFFEDFCGFGNKEDKQQRL